MNGRRPMSFPIRERNAVKCVLPVWEVPKAMLDACYPHYSESNYAERVDTTTVQRSLIYFSAHCLDALVPQLSISLMDGIQRLMTDLGGWQELLPVYGTPLMHTDQGDGLSETEVITMLRRFFPGWQPAWLGRWAIERGTRHNGCPSRFAGGQSHGAGR